MIEIKGRYSEATAYVDIIEEQCLSQIYRMCKQKVFKDTIIKIMPDTHAGKGSVVGFTCANMEYIIPNIIGSDIGCGMEVTNLGNVDIDFEKLDNFIIENIPFSIHINKTVDKNVPREWKKLLQPLADKLNLDIRKVLKAIGSLGGGNHFIEINQGQNNEKYLVIHSGSRRLGNEAALYYQRRAEKYCKEMREKSNKDSVYHLPKELSFLEGEDAEEYLETMRLIQKYADLNRKVMSRKISEYLGVNYNLMDKFSAVHNYYNFEDDIIRKGAISAKEGERVIIPINMRDGSILAVGKGNEKWNYSAPHGAGRLMSRGEAKGKISLEEFQKSMKGIYSSSVKNSTIDEAPMAYKPIEDIMANLDESVEILEIIKPVYNFKA